MGVAVADSEFHVLAVDDSVIDRKLIERLLKRSSFQVTTVDSGSKALEFLGWHEDEGESKCNETYVSPKIYQEVEVDLLITDYCMPGMTGYDLLKKMKESSSLRNIPVVIMSSENVPSRVSRCLEEGAEEFFLKPVRLTDVNKLRPHMKKTKSKDVTIQKPENEGKRQENTNNKETTEETSLEELSSDQVQFQTAKSVQQLQNSSNNSSSKRKSMDEQGLPPDRTRTRHNGGLTVMSN